MASVSIAVVRTAIAGVAAVRAAVRAAEGWVSWRRQPKVLEAARLYFADASYADAMLMLC